MATSAPIVGVLALQGGYAPHCDVLRSAGFVPREVRRREDLEECLGLVLPGGESTTHLRLIDRWDLEPALREFVRSGKPVLATCAGLILCASEVLNPKQRSFAWLDVTVTRNAWGRQLDSFQAPSDRQHGLIFIRAPRISRVGAQVEVIDTLVGEPIAVRQGAVIGATFHPELGGETWLHEEAFKGLRGLSGVAR